MEQKKSLKARHTPKGCLVFFIVFFLLFGTRLCNLSTQEIISTNTAIPTSSFAITKLLSNFLSFFEKTKDKNVYKLTTDQTAEYFNPEAFARDGKISSIEDLQKYDNYINEKARSCRKKLLKENKNVKDTVAMNRFMINCLKESGLPANTISYFNTKQYLYSKGALKH